MSTINIDGIEYVTKSEEPNYEYVIIRGDKSGVFAGFLKNEEGQTATLQRCRRLWYWDGAASISQIAVDGVSKPENCKFSIETGEHKIYDVIEMIPATTQAKDSIQAVAMWAK